MKFRLLRRNSFFYLIIAGFAVMVFVEWPLLNSAYKGKEKEFNDKLFQVAPFVTASVVHDTAAMNKLTSDSAVIHFVQTRVTPQIDSFFERNDIRVPYVYAVGKLPDISGYSYGLSSFREHPFFIYTSDSTQAAGLADTRLTVAHLGPKNSDLYYVKIFLPAKPSFLFRQLLPLVVISGISILLLFVCFLILVSIIRRQSSLALAKENFINNMTHELKTPLFTISLASKMLAAQDTIKADVKLISYTESITEETTRLIHLVERLLETSALEHRRLDMEKKQVDLHQVVRTAVRSFDLIRKEQGASIELSLAAANPVVSGDENLLTAAVCSLIDNAFKYSEKPAQIHIATATRDRRIELSVADKGIGIDGVTRQQIFDRFFRGHTGDLHDVKGYGIGLSYVKTIVETHGGTITVKSDPGKGSAFILSLPYGV